MLPDSLYASAFAVKKAKLWKKLHDSQIFAVRHFDSSISYCCVMGNVGQHYALAFFLGDAGLASLDRLNREMFQTLPSYKQHELFFSQDCIAVSFVNKSELREHDLAEITAYCKVSGIQPRGAHAYPQFERCRPHFVPWYMDSEIHQRYMQEGLNAALEVARRLEKETPEAFGLLEGFLWDHGIPLLTATENGYIWDTITPKPQPAPDYPAAVLPDELAFARIKQSKSVSGEWDCAIVLHGQPFVLDEEHLEAGEEPLSAPFFPFVLMILQPESGEILSLIPAENPEDYVPEFVDAVLQTAHEHGRPTMFRVQDERTHSFLLPIAKALGIPLDMKDAIEPLCDALEHYTDHFSDASDDSLNVSEEEFNLLAAVLRDKDALRQMPQPLFEQVFSVVNESLFPPDVCRSVRKEAARRGMSIH